MSVVVTICIIMIMAIVVVITQIAGECRLYTITKTMQFKCRRNISSHIRRNNCRNIGRIITIIMMITLTRMSNS